MAKIDRLGWAAGLSFTTYGLRCGVRVNEPALIDRVVRRLPPGWKPSRDPRVKKLYSLRMADAAPRPGMRGFNLLYAGSQRLARHLELESALAALESDLKLWVAGTTKLRVFVHAGVVGWRGRAILLPGRSYSGKSRLVEALVRAGCTYYSDEYAVLDGRGRVHPYLAPLSLRGNGTEASRRIEAAALGGRGGKKPLPVALVAALRYQAGSRRPPRRLSPGQGMLALLNNTVPARRRPRLAVATLSQVVTRALVLAGLRGEADEAAARLVEAMALL